MTTIWTDLLGCEVRYRGTRYRTRTIEAGSGPVLLLLHGVGGHAEAYSRNIKRLSKHFHVIALDFLWHGFSSKPDEVPAKTISSYCDQIIDLMDSMGIKRAAIEGESLGGWVAFWMALHHRDRLTHVILNTAAGVKFKNEAAVKIDVAGGLTALRERSLAAIRNPNRETIKKRLEWLMAHPDRVTEELIDIRYALYTDPATQASVAKVFERSFLELHPEQIFEEDLAKISTPTLTLWSDKNPGHGEEVGKRIAELIPGSEYYCIKDAGHWPQWEKPEDHDAAVIKFLLA